MRIIISFTLFLAMLIACKPSGNATGKEDAKQDTTKLERTQTKKITITPVMDSPAYPNAKITAVSPSDMKKMPSGKLNFEYKVDQYELGMQTADAGSKMCNNSDKGQHIHHILNNEPYTAYYENKWEKELPDGNYTSLAFLSRSYHESIKTKDAYTLQTFTIGNAPKEEFDKKAAHLFYSRPKGQYIGPKNIEKVLLDFFLVNTDLAEDGNKVKAVINGNEFIIAKWQPYFIEGLPVGDTKISLELIDKDGNLIPGPYNKVERTINLALDEPIVK